MPTLIPRDTAINFIGARWIALTLSAALIVASVALLATRGLTFGVDFTGGTVVEIRLDEAPDLPALRASLGGASVQAFGAPNDLLIRLPPSDDPKATVDALRAALDAQFPGVEYRRVESVGPQVGAELARKGVYAVLFALAGILAYIWLRFEWRFGVAAIGALAHDAVLTLGLFAGTGMEFSLASVAAILMIAGYSINDTVVVFDRVRENMRMFRAKPLADLLNESVNQTLSRTVMTSATTLLALGALWALGGEVIAGFVYALVFGIVVGTYSSVFVAAPLLLALEGAGPRRAAASAAS